MIRPRGNNREDKLVPATKDDFFSFSPIKMSAWHLVMIDQPINKDFSIHNYRDDRKENRTEPNPAQFVLYESIYHMIRCA